MHSERHMNQEASKMCGNCMCSTVIGDSLKIFVAVNKGMINSLNGYVML